MHHGFIICFFDIILVFNGKLAQYILLRVEVKSETNVFISSEANEGQLKLATALEKLSLVSVLFSLKLFFHKIIITINRIIDDR